MTYAFKTHLKPLLLASLLAGSSLLAMAQNAPPTTGPQDGPPKAQRGMMRHEAMDPAKMQEHMAKRQAALKARLKIEASQESAWTHFTSAMKPPADMAKRRGEMRAEMQKLSTPERIDKMKSLRAERDSFMDKRADAVKTFYAALNPEQKKIFDAQPMMPGRDQRRGHMHGGLEGPMGGQIQGHRGAQMDGQAAGHDHGKS